MIDIEIPARMEKTSFQQFKIMHVAVFYNGSNSIGHGQLHIIPYLIGFFRY